MNLINIDLTTIGVIAVALYLLWYLKRKSHWQKMGVSEAKTMPIVSITGSLMLGKFQELEKKWLKQYGKVYGSYETNGTPLLTVADPEIIKTILVRDFHIFNQRRGHKLDHKILNMNLFRVVDDDWKRLRAIISPTFSSGKMRKMHPLVQECVTHLLNNLETHANQKKEVDLKDVYGCLTMDVIAKCAFGIDTNAHEDRDNPFIKHVKGILGFSKLRIFFLLLTPSFVLKMLGVDSFASKEDNDFIFNATRHVIKKRKDNNEIGNDFLQLLMDCQVDAKSNSQDEKELDLESHYVNEDEEELKAKENALNIKITNKKLTEDEILAQSWVFFLAGYETTATTLANCTYELAVNQDVQEKLFHELQSATNNGQEIDYETLSRLPFLDAVISETLRKHPPVLRLERRTSRRYQIDNTNIVLSKGDLVEIPIFAIHHCEEFYPDPDQFKPERFLPENRRMIKPYTYLPFGAGPRNCIGMRFSLFEAKLTLAKILPKYRFICCKNTDVPLQPVYKAVLNSSKRIIVGIEKRNA